MQTPPELCCVTEAPITQHEAEDLASVLSALADPVRLRILSIIAAAPELEVCACDLPAAVDRSQPTVSHHLKLLVEAGICVREQRGKWAWFKLQPGRLSQIQAALSIGNLPQVRS